MAHAASGCLVARSRLVLRRCRMHGFLLMSLLALAAARGVARETPRVVVLGTAQDGGLPQIGCEEAPCRRARRNPRFARRVASLLVVDPRSGRRYLLDATPDLPEQVELARTASPERAGVDGRPPLFDGIFLTHAHLGHYAGLLQLGREAYGAAGQEVLVTARMRAFLESNGPWSLLVSEGHVKLREMQPDVEIPIGDDLAVTPILVPHRDELSDTVGFLIAGPSRRVLYIPDIDKWERWERRIEDVIASVDVALIDGTFFEDGEIPGRSMADIPHPFIVETLKRLAALPPGERAKIVFTHLNHTNPACDPRSAAARRIRAAGMSVARDGDVIPL
jgi:pyrroloquinoline quinone biosynthesis protein B